VVIVGSEGAVSQEAAAKASSCNEGHTLSACLDFADLHRAQKIRGHKDRWARQLSDFEMAARQKTAEPTNLKEFLDFAAAARRRWTAQEKMNWRPLVGKLSDLPRNKGRATRRMPNGSH